MDDELFYEQAAAEVAADKKRAGGHPGTPYPLPSSERGQGIFSPPALRASERIAMQPAVGLSRSRPAAHRPPEQKEGRGFNP
jgi:hypothetical protein